MGEIRVLPSTVADQIAAGEVVERPASVVKELAENALDAGARHVTVVLEDGGRTLVLVSDDGSGMDREDAVRALERHATSKIASIEDLIGVPTYGFRGEALPAIASVSQLEVETATHADTLSGVGTRIVSKGGRIESVEPAARAQGTTVAVRRIFYNTPARRKFLRSQRSETRAAVQTLTTLALARLDVAFTLTSDGRTLLDVRAASSVNERVASLFGRRVADGLIPADFRSGTIHVRGLIQRPADAGASGRKAMLFVGDRPIKDPFLVRAAEAGYRGTIPADVRPSMFLSLDAGPDGVDVNVHPAKLEVRFRDRFLVERTVEQAVREALRRLESSAVMSGGAAAGFHPATSPGDLDRWATDAGATAQSTLPLNLFPDGDVMRVVAGAEPRAMLQVLATYVVFETPEGIAIVDQHSAHERVLYERAMAQLTGADSAAQHLLLPLTFDLEADELDVVEAERDLLAAVGFEVEGFGGRSVVVHAVPNPHPRFDAGRCFGQLVADLSRGRLAALNRLERFAATYACRAAIKAGHRLDQAEMRDLIDRLFECQLPPHDVHGRPTIVQLPTSELERRFGRS